MSNRHRLRPHEVAQKDQRLPGRLLRVTRASEIEMRATVLPPECRAAGCRPTGCQDGRLKHHRPGCQLPSSYRVPSDPRDDAVAELAALDGAP